MNPPPDQTREIKYEPAGPTIAQFHASSAFVRGIMGPFGSSKSTACVMEILSRSSEQRPGPDGVRRTRWGVIRNSYPELKTTTLKTWADWCPPTFGRLTHDSPIRHFIQSGDLEIEVLFMALDKEEDVRKLLSLELTGAWLNEAREIPKAILDAVTGRVGRFPSRMNGGCTWSGIICDTNPPDDQSWWYKMAEEETPDGWRFFKQPSGTAPDAENLQNLPDGYYQRISSGKDEDWIKVYVNGDYGYVTEGKAVFPMFRDRVHVSPVPLLPLQGFPLLLGCDYGLTPAAIIGQKLTDGRWVILDEVVTDSCGVVRFAELLAKYVATTYVGFDVDCGFGDPSGNQRAFSDERTAFEIMKEYTSWKWQPAPSNEPVIRREVVIGALNRLVDGNPGILISPKCINLRKGFSGGYHFKFLKNAGGTQFHETPSKNQYSHPHDALQYLLLGGGEHNVVLNKMKKKANASSGPRQALGMDYDVFNSTAPDSTPRRGMAKGLDFPSHDFNS